MSGFAHGAPRRRILKSDLSLRHSVMAFPPLSLTVVVFFSALVDAGR